jgi:hypothetical protein
VLLEFYPQALQAFPSLKHKAALTVLAVAPFPEDAQRLTRSRLVSLLNQCGRRNNPALVEQILSDLKAPALRQPAQIESALGATVAGLVTIVVSMQHAVEHLETRLKAEFDTHPQAVILRSASGLGPILAARMLAEIGDDPTRFDDVSGLRAFAGTAPVTIASGRPHYVKARKVRNKRLGDACHWWAFATPTNSAGARACYDKRRAAGDHHNAARAAILDDLAERFAERCRSPVDYIEQNWSVERYSGGGMISHAPPSVLTSFGHALRPHCGRIHRGGNREFIYRVRMGRRGSALR